MEPGNHPICQERRKVQTKRVQTQAPLLKRSPTEKPKALLKKVRGQLVQLLQGRGAQGFQVLLRPAGFDRFDSFPDIVRLAAAVSADEGGLGGLQPLFDEEELELDSLESSDNSSSFDSSEDEGEAGNGEEEPSKVGVQQPCTQVV
jgi:hypothetical protein